MEQTSTTGRPAYGRLMGLSWAHFLNDGAANFLPGVLPAILVSQGLSLSVAGTLMAALVVGQGMQPFTGLLSDKIGGRSLIMIGFAGTSLCGALVGFAPGFWPLVLLLIVIGLSNSFFHPQALVVVRGLAGERKGSGTSVFLVGGEIGRGLWPLIASWMVTIGGLGFLWVLGIPALLTLLFIPLLAPPIPPRAQNANPINWGRHLKPLGFLVAFSALRSLLLYSIATFVPLRWQSEGGTLIVGAAFITTLMLVGIIGNLGGGRLSDRFGRHRLVMIGMGMTVVSMALFMLSKGAWEWIFIALAGIFIFSTVPLTILMGQDIVPENRSFGSGVALGFANAIGALAVMVLGPVAASAGTNAALWTAIAGGAIAFVLVRWLPRDQQAQAAS